MCQELIEKVAIITGAANGIGRASAEMFVKEGAQVVIADVDTERGEALAEKLGSAAVFRYADVTSADDIQSLVDFAVHHFGGLDVMWNNAGLSSTPYSRFIDDDLRDFQKVIAVNLYGVMLGSQCAARYMKDHGGGSIINTASLGGVLAGFGIIPYRAAKAAVVQFSKSIAIDFGEYNIRVNCINPGGIQTEMSTFPDSGMSQETVKKINEAVEFLSITRKPLKQKGKPADVANAGVFLASDRAKYISGVDLAVDGGHNAGDQVNHLEKIIEARTKVLNESPQVS